MDEQRFDKLARSLAKDTNRRGFLKRVAGVVAGAAAVAVPVKAAALVGDYCDYSNPCTGYGEVCNEYTGKCECDEYSKHCEYDNTCIPTDACCGEGGKNYVCSYGEWICPDYDGYRLCGTDCIDEYSCCPDDEVPCPNKGEYCDYGYSAGVCTCDGYYCDDYSKYPGICVSYEEGSCCSDKDCESYASYGEEPWTCEYGTCTAPVVEEPETPPTNGETGTTPPPPSNYSKQLNRACNAKCVKNARNKAKRKKTRLTSAKVKRIRNTCKRRCARNSR